MRSRCFVSNPPFNFSVMNPEKKISLLECGVVNLEKGQEKIVYPKLNIGDKFNVSHKYVSLWTTNSIVCKIIC